MVSFQSTNFEQEKYYWITHFSQKDNSDQKNAA